MVVTDSWDKRLIRLKRKLNRAEYPDIMNKPDPECSRALAGPKVQLPTGQHKQIIKPVKYETLLVGTLEESVMR